MANSICVLHSWEVADFEKTGIRPACRNHKHIKRIEAMEITARGDNIRECASARWVGPRQISITHPAKWIPRQSGFGGPTVMQMSEV